MKICYVINSAQIGGAEIHYLDLASGMLDRGHEVISMMPKGPIADKSRALGVKVINLSPKLDVDPLFIYKAAKIFKKDKVDVVHTLQLKTNVNGLIAASVARVPIKVGHLLGSLIDWEVSIWKTIPNVIANSLVMNLCANYVMALSPTVAGTLHNKEKIINSKIKIVPASIDVESFHEAKDKKLINTKLNLKPKTILIGSVGRLTIEKGHRYLVESAPYIRKAFPNVQIVLIGDGVERPTLEELIKKLKVSSFVHLLGIQSEENKKSMLKELDLFVFPSIREGFGIAMIEAMATGTVVIASELPEIKSVVDRTEVVFFRPRDPEDLATNVGKVLTNENLRDKLRLNAYKKVKSHYSHRTALDKYEDLYHNRK